MKNKTLFVGCGGSGLKTLQRLNELLSGNPANRQMLRENISYLILDTSVSETEDFKENIRKHLGNAGLPFIKVVQFTRNITNLEEIVKPTFSALEARSKSEKLGKEEREEAAAQLARLKKNWWYSPDHEPDGEKTCPSHPFRAQNITDGLSEGAGQCGPVAFLAAWNYLPSLEQDLNEVIDAIQLRNTDNQMMSLNVFIVAGTAGGTGRGCWQPVAFKVAQCLREKGFNCNPTGVFFDSSCFPTVMEGGPNERLNMSVNSLTAMSELSAWMMQPVIRSFYFSLPNLRNPGVCDLPFGKDNPGNYYSSTDVVAVPSDGDNELSPVTNAYLIFGNNGVAPLANNKQYHEMAAAALYAMVAEDKFIGPGAVNRHESVRSFGAVTFEVETIPIRRYMEALVRREYSKSLYLEAKPRPEDKRDEDAALEPSYALDEEANRIVGEAGRDYSDIEDADKPFFARTRFSVDDEVNLASIEPNNTAKATLLQSLMAISASETFDWDPDNAASEKSPFDAQERQLVEALKKQSVQAANACVEEMFSLEDFSLDGIEKFLATRGLDEKSLENTIKNTIFDAFASKGMAASVGRAQAVLQKMKNRFLDSRKNLVGDIDSGIASGVMVDDNAIVRNVDECVESFQSDVISPRAKKSFFSFKTFSAKDIAGIKDKLGAYLVCALFFKVRKTLADKFKKAVDMLSDVEKSLATLVKGLDGVRKSFETELCKACGVKSGDIEEAYRNLFVDYNESDLSAVFRSLPKMDANENIYRRVLKPIMSRQNVEDLVRRRMDAFEPPIRECLARFMRDLIKGDVYATPEDAREAVRKAFVDLVSSNVSLEYSNGVDFMTSNFSFEKVLKENLKAWDALLRARKGSEDDLGEIKDRLRKFLGVTEDSLIKLEDGTLKIDPTAIWDDIVVSMAGDCKPWMLPSEDARPTFLKAIALLPWNMNDPTRDGDQGVARLAKEVKDKFHGKVLDVRHTGDGGGFSLPKDRIVVFSASAITVDGDENPFDFIKSLSYYKDADFSRLLELAEDDKDNAAYYYPIRNPAASVKWGERRDTHGYVSPIFIHEPSLASTRWRPWLPWSGGYDAAKKRDADVKNAICFALLGTGNIPDAAKSSLTDAGWVEYPILKQGSTKESLKFVRKCSHDKNAWELKEFSTIGVLKQFLSGEGRKSLQEQGGPALEKDKVAGDRARNAILQEFVAFRNGIVRNVGKTVIAQLVKSLADWLDERDDTATSNKEDWKSLYEFVNSGDFMLD